MKKIICKQCSKEFSDFPSNHRVFCSKSCKHLYQKGKPTNMNGLEEYIKLFGSGNKGKKYPYKPHYKHRGKLANDKNPQWKGDAVSKEALHKWVERHLGKPSICEFCRTTDDRKYAWANKSGKYKRDLSDWYRLCYPCHMRYDNVGRKSWETRRRLYG